MIHLRAKKNFAIQLSRKVMQFQKTLTNLKAGPRGPPTKTRSPGVFLPMGMHFLKFLLKKKCSGE